MAFSFIRTATGSGSGTVVGVTVTATTANDLLVISVKTSVNPGTTSITDNVGNTYAMASQVAAAGFYVTQYYGVQITGGATSISLTAAVSVSARIVIDEYSGNAVTNAAVFDVSTSNQATGATSSVALSPSASGNLIAACVAFGAGTTITAGSGYTTAANTGMTVATEYKLSSTTSEIADAAFASQAWGEVATSFKPAGGSTVPGAPTIGTAVAGAVSATVNWTAPASNGGSAITGYTIRAYAGGSGTSSGSISAASGATSIVYTGLTSGVAYKFDVLALNAIGTGTASAKSNSVTPTALPPSTPSLYDTFTDTDGVSISSHTPDIGGPWSQTAGTSFYIQSNSLKGNRNTDGDLATVDGLKTDYTLTTTVTPAYVSSGNKSMPDVVVRYTDASNFWYLYPDTQAGIIYLYQVSAGSHTIRVTYPFSQSNGVPINVRLDCVGADITIWLNGREILTYTSTAVMTSTVVGVRLGTSGSGAVKCSWDDFKVLAFQGSAYNWPVFVKNPTNLPVLARGTGSQWDATDANDPNIAYDSANNRLVMEYSGYYNGGTPPGSNVQHQGQAYLAGQDPSVGSWTKEVTNPVQTSIGEDGIYAWNGGFCKKGSTWYRVYGSDNGSRLRLSTSTDLLTWTRQGYSIPLGGVGSWDESGHFDAFLRLRQDGVTFELWYVGKNSSNVRQLGYATSTDCLNWTKFAGNPVIKPVFWASSNAIHGEPSVFVPDGKEGLEMLVTFDTARSGAANNRFIAQAITVDGGTNWAYRMSVSSPTGGGAWESAQNFDSFIYKYGNNLHLFYGGADIAGPSLNLDIQIGMSTASWPYSSLSTAPVSVSVGGLTGYSAQTAMNLINGSAPAQYTIQYIANVQNGYAPTQYTFQYILNMNLGVAPTFYSEQVALFKTLQSVLSLTGNETQYSVQALLNLAYQSSVPIGTIV